MERVIKIDDEIVIRPLRESDIPDILAIDAQITGQSRPELYAERAVYYLRNPMACWGAEVNGTLVGFILGDIRGWEFGLSESGWIEILGVLPEYQRKGIGSAMLKALLEHMKERGVKRVRAMSRWYDPILSFLRAEGFEHGELLSVQKDLE